MWVLGGLVAVLVGLSSGAQAQQVGTGAAGIGLGVESLSATGWTGCARVLVEASATLLLDVGDLGGGSEAFTIPEDVRSAMRGCGHRVGLTVKITRRALEATLRAGDPETMSEFKASLPLEAGLRRSLISRPLAILARDGYHGITPFFDDARRKQTGSDPAAGSSSPSSAVGAHLRVLSIQNARPASR